MSRKERLSRLWIYLQAFGSAGAYILSVVLTWKLYVGHLVQDAGIAFGVAFCLVQAMLIVVLFLLSMAIKFVRHWVESRWERLRPSLLKTISASLTGNSRLPELEALQKRYPREIERCVAELLVAVGGTGRKGLARLAADLGLDKKWQLQAGSYSARRRKVAISRLARLESDAAIPVLLKALEDPDDEIRLEASSALIRSSNAAEIAAVFQTAVRDSLFIRAILTEALRPHILALSKLGVPEALAASEPKYVRTTLEIVRAWGRAVPIQARPLLAHEDPGVRAAALAILPQVGCPRDYEAEVLRLLSDDHEVVRAAAAEVAGRLRLVSALPGLHRCLQETGFDSPVAAAYALARLGPDGCDVLEREVLYSRTTSAAVALEAIEQLKSKRLQLAEL